MLRRLTLSLRAKHLRRCSRGVAMGNVIYGTLATILLFIWIDQSIEISSFSVYAAVAHFFIGAATLAYSTSIKLLE